jgi:putative Ig domain-containing protein
MRGCGRAPGFLAATVLFVGACTLGGGSTNPTANISPASSPSTNNNNSGTTIAPPPASPSAQASPSATAPVITALPVHNGEVGVGYLAVTFTAAGGTPPYSWAVAGGAFPPGLSLSSGGVLNGKNTTPGTYGFSVKVTDSAGEVTTGSTKIQVFPPFSVSQPCATVCYVGTACTTCGRFGSVSGGAGPYHYKIVSGAIPTGMTLNGLLLNGPWPVPTFTTVPVDAVSVGPILTMFPWGLGVQVTDDFGVTKTVSANWLEFFPIAVNCSTGTPCLTCTTACTSNTSITYAFGSPSGPVSVVLQQVCNNALSPSCTTDPTQFSKYLPPAWSATATGGVVTVSACNATCATGNGFSGDVFFVLVDHGACVAPTYAQTSSVADVRITIP